MNTDRYYGREEDEDVYSRPSFHSDPYLSDLDVEDSRDYHDDYRNYYYLYGDDDEDGNPEWCMDEEQCFEEDELYSEDDVYSEEVYVDDQCCSNCRFCGGEDCPMYIDDYQSPVKWIQRMRRRKEDASFRDGKLVWCIYWKGKPENNPNRNPNRNPREFWRQY